MYRLNFRSTVRKKIILLGSLAIIIPMIIGNYLLVERLRHNRIIETTLDAEKLMLSVSLSVQQWDNKLSSLTQMLAVSPVIRSMNIRNINDFLIGFSKIYSEVYVTYVCDKNGKMILRSDHKELLNNSDREYIQRALIGERITSEPVLSKTLNKPAVCFASPIKDDKDNVIGAVALCTLTEQFSAELKKLRQGSTGNIYVTNKKNILVASTNDELLKKLTDFNSHPAFKNVITPGKSIVTEHTDKESRGWIYTSTSTESGWKTLIEVNKQEILDSTNEIQWIGIILTLILIFCVNSMMIWAVLTVLKPLPVFTRALQALQNGELKERISFHSNDEFGIISEAFNNMAEKMEFLFQENEAFQSRLIETNMRLENDIIEKTQQLVSASKMSALGEMMGGVAHEINTPLATIKLLTAQAYNETQEDLLDVESLSDHLKKIDITTDRIAKIIKGLKTFARAGDYDPMEVVSIQSVIDDTIILCSEQFKKNNVELRTILPKETIQLECRPVELSQVILNLVSNAIDAIQDKSDKWVEIDVKDNNENIEIKITDSGNGIPAEAREKIFQPFFTTKPVGKGTGIGLSISHGIVKNHQGQLYIDDKCPHTCFVITIPKKQVSVFSAA